MKKEYAILLLFFTLMLPFCTYTQVSIEKTILNTNLFEKFLKGSVLMKDGRIEEALLNYDTETQSIVFKKDEQVLILTDLPSVDTVSIQLRRFVPVGNTFYEVAFEAPGIGLYVTYSNKRKPVSSTADYGGTSKKNGNQVNNSLNPAYVSRPNQLNYIVDILPHYWIKKENSLYKANNEAQLIKIFPSKDKEAIKNYIRENSIDFSQPEDLVQLMGYCKTLLK